MSENVTDQKRPGQNQAEGSVVAGSWEPVDQRRWQLGEGARYLGPASEGPGGFVCVDLLRGRLFSTLGEPDAQLTLRAELDRPLGAVALRSGRAGSWEESTWVAALGKGLSLLRAEDGVLQESEVLASPAERQAQPELRVNDAVADPHGRFWVGAMAYEGDEGQGFLARLDPDGGVEIVLEDMSIPNGPAFSPDGRTMYLADTPTGQITTYDVDPATGSLSAPRPFVQVEEGGPDGMTVDAQGCLWSAVWGAACLHRYSPTGDLLERIPVPARQPTSVALTAEPPYRALVTTAAIGLETSAAHDGRVLTAPVTVAGISTPVYGLGAIDVT
ncbi:SMP-30/gluconolactonase/LRE family protein [Nesterenkonia alba]|uniref:SMP-30/gluconolactonase/LRE family protein n=1 Tax=Nesterenkonia alba TaxID=515814 RepID=UPI0003B4F99F|nr:SMP-30/gluconolactonase/LRE family protein [Nesterenkonia alba]